MNVAEVIRNRRKMLGISQAKLSEISGVHIATISAYETGRYTVNMGTAEILLNSMGLELCVRRKQK